MNNHLIIVALTLFAMLPGTSKAQGTENKVVIHTIGDSTMSHYDQNEPSQKGMDGWGDFLQDCMTEGVVVHNWADRGETARSYYRGYWNGMKPKERPDFKQEIHKEVKSGDYVIIQFGHNDSKSYSTIQYEAWLDTLVEAVRKKGATPLIASSICRSRFDSNGKIKRIGRIDSYDEPKRILEPGDIINEHTFDYPYHAKKVADSKNVQFIDVTTSVKDLFEYLGEETTRALFPGDERTHTNALGAKIIAKIVAGLLLQTELKDYINQAALTLPTKREIEGSSVR